MTDIQLEKRPQIGLRRGRSNLYEVSSVFNVCLSFTKQVNYKVSSIAKKICTFVIAEQLLAGKLLLQ